MNQENMEPRYVISVAARILGVRTHTLRYYEKIGIVEPSRSRGNIRLYSQRDIEEMQRMKNLIEKLGVNLAGAEVIMRMTKRISELQRELERVESELEELKRR